MTHPVTGTCTAPPSSSGHTAVVGRYTITTSAAFTAPKMWYTCRRCGISLSLLELVHGVCARSCTQHTPVYPPDTALVVTNRDVDQLCGSGLFKLVSSPARPRCENGEPPPPPLFASAQPPPCMPGDPRVAVVQFTDRALSSQRKALTAAAGRVGQGGSRATMGSRVTSADAMFDPNAGGHAYAAFLGRDPADNPQEQYHGNGRRGQYSAAQRAQLKDVADTVAVYIVGPVDWDASNPPQGRGSTTLLVFADAFCELIAAVSGPT